MKLYDTAIPSAIDLLCEQFIALNCIINSPRLRLIMKYFCRKTFFIFVMRKIEKFPRSSHNFSHPRFFRKAIKNLFENFSFASLKWKLLRLFLITYDSIIQTRSFVSPFNWLTSWEIKNILPSKFYPRVDLIISGERRRFKT